MDKLKKEIESIEAEIEKIQEAYADECIVLFNQEGYDSYKRKWQKKLEKIADKYAPELADLLEEHKELRLKYDELLEEKRKSKYKDA